MPRAVSRNHTLDSCIGIDDGPFLPKKLGGSKAPLVAVSLEGSRLVSASAGWIAIDGKDGTEQAVHLLKRLFMRKCPILLAGVTFGGFNLIDPRKLHRLFRVPTIVVVGSRPDNMAVKRALVKHFPDWRERWEIIRSLGPLRKVRTVKHENPIFYECIGCAPSVALEILVTCAVVARVPEPLRVADCS
jgi:hypothetical protein